MAGFTTKINLLQDSIFIKEIKVRHFKTLLKTLLGDEPNIEDVFNNLLNVLTQTTQLSIKEIKELSVIDFLLIIINLRCISIGDSIQLEITDKTNTKLTLNLNKVLQTLQQSFNFNFTQIIQNIKIEYKFLSIYDFLFFNDSIDELLVFKQYIKKIHFANNDCIEILKLKDKEFIDIFKALPVNYSSLIIKHITELIQKFNQINLLNYLTDKNLSLYLNQNTFTFILQILFSRNLLPLYENIFALAKFANISPEYIEECTPGEYTIFVKLLERILKEQNSQQSQSSNTLPPINEENPNFM